MDLFKQQNLISIIILGKISYSSKFSIPIKPIKFHVINNLNISYNFR